MDACRQAAKHPRHLLPGTEAIEKLKVAAVSNAPQAQDMHPRLDKSAEKTGAA
jgi:hypothetical protein